MTDIERAYEFQDEQADSLIIAARDVLNRLTTYAPDVGVDEFHDALHEARLLIARIDGAE